MLLPDWAVLNAAIDWLGNGLWNLSWWQIVLFTLAIGANAMVGRLAGPAAARGS